MIPVVSRVVEVCVFRFRRDRAEYLILQRSQEKEIHPGMWQIITGWVEPEETGVAAALRELREETGCAPAAWWVVPGTTTFYDPAKNEVNLCPVFAVQLSDESTVRLSPEHVRCEWLPRGDAIRRLVWPSHRAALQIVDEYIVADQEAARRVSLPLP